MAPGMGRFAPELVPGHVREIPSGLNGNGKKFGAKVKRGTRICGCGLELRTCDHGSARGPKPSGRGRNTEQRAYVSAHAKATLSASDVKAGAIVEAVASAAERSGISIRAILEDIERRYGQEKPNAA